MPKGQPNRIEMPEPEKADAPVKLDPALVAKARELVAGFKLKYSGTTERANPLEVCAEYAFKTWEKAALGNPRIGAAQLQGGEPVIESYFRRKLVMK